MALRVPIPAVTGPGDRKVSSGQVRSARPASVRASSAGASGVKQRSFSPVKEQAAFAPHLGLEMTVLELERLYSAVDPALRSAGPGSPAGFGSSGRPVRVAYQGTPGSYCQEAAMSAFATCDAFPCYQMEDAFQALLEKTADRAVIPFENSVDGVIYRNLDLLLRHNVSIVGELLVPVNHCLLAAPGASLSGLRRIASHPQALSHCRSRIEELGVEVEEVSNSAEAARFLSENPVADTAVIGSKIAAREFGLQILEQNFQDRNESNVNRFFQLSLDPALPSPGTPGVRKTTIAFSLKNAVSDLFRALWPFESRNIPVTSVQHRPNRKNPVRLVDGASETVRYFDYVFIVDLQGCASDRAVERALEQLKEITGFLRILGTYASR
ncbi:Arogenate dehydratase/prephenate dehydratase 6 [Nymphaea thermarum]|nr:Arogenate dehydratase/prephenate dehydratase 6 [Nymphaea thermarum]